MSRFCEKKIDLLNLRCWGWEKLSPPSAICYIQRNVQRGVFLESWGRLVNQVIAPLKSCPVSFYKNRISWYNLVE